MTKKSILEGVNFFSFFSLGETHKKNGSNYLKHANKKVNELFNVCKAGLISFWALVWFSLYIMLVFALNSVET